MRKKYKLVAIATNGGRCCKIYSPATFKQLAEDYDLYAKSYSATNWCGQDDTDRTLKIDSLELTGEVFDISRTVRGCDNDHGHTYPWNFKFTRVHKVRRIV